MRRAVKIVSLVVLALLLILLGTGFYLVLRVGKSSAETRRFLLHDVNYHDVSVACLELMTKPEFRPLIGEYPAGDAPQLPPAIRNVKAVWLGVSTNEIVIMKTLGFYQLGLVFHPSSTVSNSFELAFREAGKPDHDSLLYTLPMPK